MQLPNADQAVIPPAKMDYVLNSNHPANDGKARLFYALGYTLENWERLEADIREQHLPEEAIEVEPTKHGRKLLIEAPLQGPTGRANIRTVWIIRWGEDVPRFVTAYRLD